MAKVKVFDGYQQGDVKLVRISSLPGELKKLSPVNGRFVLAEGESTGHAHAIAEREDVELFERNGTLYLKVGEAPAALAHEEHGVQTIEPGTYEVGTVQEIDPFTEEIRSVRD